MITFIHVQKKDQVICISQYKDTNRADAPEERWILLGMIIYEESNISIETI